MPPMVGRFLALCGRLAEVILRPLRRTPLRRLGSAPAVLVAMLLLAAASAPIAVPLLDPQPETLGVPAIFDGAVNEPDGWVRLEGRLVRLVEPPTQDHDGPYALLIDAEEQLRSIVVVTTAEPSERTVVTGHLESATVTVEEQLPIEATMAGTPPRVVPDRLLVADPVAVPERSIWWPLAVPPALLGILLLIGSRTGYPVFRPAVEVDVLSAPLGPGERVPAAWGGRIGPNRASLHDPAAALLLVRRATVGNVLTAQPLADEGAAPAAVPIGGGWASGRTGYVHTVTESVPALVVRSELVDATFLFARVAERDRVAALVATER